MEEYLDYTYAELAASTRSACMGWRALLTKEGEEQRHLVKETPQD